MRWFACGLLALGALGLAQAASAQTSPQPLELGQFIDVGDAEITVVMCSSSLCGPGIQFAAAPGPNVGFVIESASDPGVDAFLSGTDDLSVAFEIATSSQDITSIGLSATGTGGASVGETVYDDGTGSGHMSCQISNGSPSIGVGSTASISLAYGQSGCSSNEKLVYVVKDLNANGGTITSVTQYVDAVGAPEPFSSAILVVGLVGLAAVRRRVCN